MLEHVAKELKLSIEFDLPEVKLPAALPTDVEGLTALLHTQQKAYEALWTETQHKWAEVQREVQSKWIEAQKEAQNELKRMLEQIVLSRRRLFGPSTEVSGQGRLFDEAEVLAQATTEASLSDILCVRGHG